jgi:hypothetical protein
VSIYGWDEILYLPELSTSSFDSLKPTPGSRNTGHGLPPFLVFGPPYEWQIRGREWARQDREHTRNAEKGTVGGEGKGGAGSGTEGLCMAQYKKRRDNMAYIWHSV